MKTLYYDEGPRVMGCGIAGEFRIGEPREVEDELAEILLKKGRLKEFKEPAPAASPNTGKRGRQADPAAAAADEKEA